MKKNLIIYNIFIILFAGCDSQVGTAVSAAISNLFTGDMFSNSTSDKAYEELKANTMSNQPSNFSGNCGNESLSPILGSAEANNVSRIKDKLCTCHAWGTCDKLSCSCEKLCPENFEILNKSKNITSDSAEDSLSFNNGDRDFYTKYKDYQGFCWGHAVVTQRFNRLATFYPEKSNKYSNPEDYLQRRREYKDIIKHINNNETVEIPGFKNLLEFSNDPEVKELLEESVKENWAQNAMSSQGLSIVASAKPQGAKYYNELFDDIEFRLKHYQSPAIVFNRRDSSAYAHTVLVSGSGVTSEGLRYLCIRDNNYNVQNDFKCPHKMYLKSDGTVSYEPWYPSDVGQVQLSYTENSNTLEQIKNLHTKCKGDKNCDNKSNF